MTTLASMGEWAYWEPVLVPFLTIFVGCFIIINFIAVYAGLSTYIERKIAAHIQHRVGPYRVGPHGILQWLADALKLIFKEDIIPAKSDHMLFRAAPYVVFAAAFTVWVALPFAPTGIAKDGSITSWSPANFNIGILYILAVGGVGVIGILMSGWGSGSKWSLFGAMRATAQIVSYEVPVGLTVLGMLLIAGSLDMREIAAAQAHGAPFWSAHDAGWHGMWSWFIFRHPPFTIIAAIVFYTAVLAETNRTPFDIPEAESELVSGYHTEYSGIRFSFFFMSEYASMFAVSAISVVLFLGAWLPPFPNMEGAGLALVLGIVGGVIGYKMYKHVMHGLFGFKIGAGIGLVAAAFLPVQSVIFMTEPLGPAGIVAEGLFWFMAKTFALLFLMMWLRWTVPRYRVDQLMDLCWKKLTPLALINFLAIGTMELGIPWLVERFGK